MPQSANGAAPTNGTAAGANGHGDLAQRLSVLETYVRSHDRTIRRVLKIASDFIENRRA
jgi:hypothetical protein